MDGRLFPLTADDLARIEHRARSLCEAAKAGTNQYRLATDVLRLLDERRRLLARLAAGGSADVG